MRCSARARSRGCSSATSTSPHSCRRSRRGTTSQRSAPRPSATSGRAFSGSRRRSRARPTTPSRAELRERLALVQGRAASSASTMPSARASGRSTARSRTWTSRCTRRRAAGSASSRRAVACRPTPVSSPTRIAALRLRIDALSTRLAATEQRQADYLARVAVDELEDQKTRLATYLVQARFALGGMYDRAANAGAAPAKTPAAEQQGAQEQPPAGSPAAGTPPAQPLPTAAPAPGASPAPPPAPAPPPEAPRAEVPPAQAPPAAAPPPAAPRTETPPATAPEPPR